MAKNKITALSKELHAELLKAIKELVKPEGVKFGYNECVTESLGFQGSRVDSMHWIKIEGKESLMTYVYNFDKDNHDSILLDYLEISDLDKILETLTQE